jgi:hypothetical protein
MFNTVRFGLHYAARVANPSDIVLFRKQRIAGHVRTEGNFDRETLETLFNVEGVSLFSTHYTSLYNTDIRMIISSFGLFERTVKSCRRTERTTKILSQGGCAQEYETSVLITTLHAAVIVHNAYYP